MKKNSFLWAALSMTAALVMTACSSDNDVTEAPVAPSTSKTIPYTVTVGSGDATTRATVKDDPTDRQLYFATGDKLYITGENIQGVLDLQDGVGASSDATFSGELTYDGSGSPADNLELTATLVSAQQTEDTQFTVDAAGAVTVNYPTAAYCATISDAVQQYSRLTGTSTYGAHAFTLTQQTAFLNFVITFEDGTTTGTVLSAVVKNGETTLCTANVTTMTEDEKVVAKFVLPVASGTELSSATVKMGDKAALAISDATLTGKVYNVKRTQAAPACSYTAPTIASNSNYSGSAQALVTAGSATNATMYYSADGGSSWSTSVPTRTNAGTYTVYYKVVPADGYSGGVESTLVGSKTINKIDWSGYVTVEKKDYGTGYRGRYTGSGTVTQWESSSNGISWTPMSGTGNPSNYSGSNQIFRVTLAGDANHNQTQITGSY